ncbi:hypothetical protein [Streptomyces sp. ODS28]|uniref:hypothetical protein n=1 Tax=Streptomyces sp. ODS28 TaxID=3136688 RepID=UPI0031EBF116
MEATRAVATAWEFPNPNPGVLSSLWETFDPKQHLTEFTADVWQRYAADVTSAALNNAEWQHIHDPLSFWVSIIT